jgi:hypothetical protein
MWPEPRRTHTVKIYLFQLSTAGASLASTASAVRARITVRKLALATCTAMLVLGSAPGLDLARHGLHVAWYV